jgi:hypothetical protein
MRFLSGIAPDDFGDAHQRQDGAVNRPMIIADHESDTKRQVKALKDPHHSHQDHRDTDQRSDDAHDVIEGWPHQKHSL